MRKSDQGVDVEKTSVELLPLIKLGNVNSVRNLVIQALGEEWPLNVRKLHTKIERQRPGVSYHAVHKAVQQLVCEAMVKRGEAGYIIDSDWVQRALSLLEGMKDCKCGERGTPLYLPNLKDFKEGDSKTFVFENLAEADKYRKRLQLEYANSKPQKHYVVIARHARSALLYSEKTLAFPMVPLSGIKGYYLIAGKTVPDEWCADYYRLQGAYAQTGVDCAHNCDIRVVGDVIEQLYVPEDTAQSTEDLFSGIRNMADLSVPEFYQSICLRRSPVKFIVIHNRELAEQIRQQVLSRFSTAKVAIVDLDGVFADPEFPVAATRWLVAKGLLNGSRSEDLVKLCDRHSAGKVPRDVFVLEYLKLYSKLIKGLSAERLQAAIRTFVETEGHNQLFKHAARLFHLIRSYRRVVAFTRLPIEFAKAMGFDFFDIIATTFETVNGAFTGRMRQNMCTPGAKEAAFESWIAANPHLDLKGSIGFGDRYHDIAFLSKVSHPFVVNLDSKLAAVAKRNGWFVFDGNVDALMSKISEVVR